MSLQSKTGENPADLDEWQSLLFADGNNPLDKIESSSSSDESEEEDARPVEVFQTKFPSKQSNEVERPASRITANRVSRATAEYFTNVNFCYKIVFTLTHSFRNWLH